MTFRRVDCKGKTVLAIATKNYFVLENHRAKSKKLSDRVMVLLQESAQKVAGYGAEVCCLDEFKDSAYLVKIRFVCLIE
jgi:hypothetical protein